MKTLLTFLLLFFINIISAQQTYTINKETKLPKTEQQLIGTAQQTQDNARYNNTLYPVYKSTRGKLFFIYKNKNNNYSKRYINLDVDKFTINKD